MSISSRLWVRCFDTALASATSPFLVALTQGKLANNSFKAYIAQDAFYLVSFKKAFASAAIICKEDSDGFGVDHFQTLEFLIEDELKMHAKFALDLNIDLSSVRPFPQTLLYTEFLGEATKTNYVSHICAAMTPCMTLYGFLGRRAKTAGLSQPSNPYARWIDEYSSPEFGANAERLEMLLDHFAAKDDQKFEDLIKLYAKAMELEYNFFSAHETANWTGVKPSFLGIDFDDTISVSDTISNLCKAGLKAQGKVGDAEYKELFTQYIQKYDAFMLSNLPQNGVKSNKNNNDLEQFMHSYSAFEDSMLTPVENSKILKGISTTSLNTLAQEISMKPNAINVMKYAIHNHPGIESHVLSVNWSKKFLQSMLKVHWPESNMSVHANELDGLQENTNGQNEEAVSTGNIDRKLTGPKQKGDLLRTLLSTHVKTNGGPSVYIGDSLGDLSALLEADVGIVIGTSSSLRKVCHIYGIEFKSLDNLIFKTDLSKSELLVNDELPQRFLYVADSWAHIGFCLFGKGYVNTFLRSFVKDIKEINRDSSVSGVEVDSTVIATATGTQTGTQQQQQQQQQQRNIHQPSVLAVAGSDSGVRM